jgi:hypothetical protein
MELKLKLSDKNTFPLGAILIRGSRVEDWLHEIQLMKLSLSQVEVYALPGTLANTVWGCLIIHESEKSKPDIGRNAYLQVAHNYLFLPERAVLHPRLSPEEAKKLFGGKYHFLHPAIGFVELESPVDWTDVIHPPELISRRLERPSPSPFIPKGIKTFQVKANTPEGTLESFEKDFPREKFSDKPLNPFEKAKLFLYRQFLRRKEADAGSGAGTGKKPTPSMAESILNRLSGKGGRLAENLRKNYEELEKRNQKHLDRLLGMLKKDPGEALKYAVPLDHEGASRGGAAGTFNMEKRWFDFSLFGSGWGGGSGAAVFADDSYRRLFEQYTNTAKELIKQKDYRKAAFVYLKLLKDYDKAAKTLEEGGLYSEAAAVYIKYCNNKVKAAECFEKGAMISNAIELHKELKNEEKVGDLYLQLRNTKEAYFYYGKVGANYLENHQYLKASLLYRNKMNDEALAQETLLKGWRAGRDAFNCLNNYFSNHRDIPQLVESIQDIYQNEVTPANREIFLRALQHEYKKQEASLASVKDIAYEIIVEEAKNNPAIVMELKGFNRKDKQLMKDAMRFKVNLKNKPNN